MSLVQSANFQNNSWSQTNSQLAYSSANTAGNMLIAIVSGGGNDSTMSLSDSQGNTWVKVAEYFHDGFFTDIAMWYCASCNAGSNTVTWTHGGWKQYRRMQIFEYSDMAASPLDDYDVFSGNLPSPGTDVISSAGITPSQSGTLLFAFYIESYVADAGSSAGTNYTQIQKSTIDYHLISEGRAYTSTSSVAATFSISSNPGGDPYPQYVGIFAVFKDASTPNEIDAAIQAKKATVSSALDNIPAIDGAIQAKKATVSGTLDNIPSVSSAIQAKKASFSATVDNIPSISGTIQAKKIQLSGASYVQGNDFEENNSSDTIQLAFPYNNTLGNLLIAVITTYGDTTYSVQDSQGNTWYLLNSYQYNSDAKIGVYYSPNCKSGANTVTVTFGTAMEFRRMALFEYYGINKNDPIDDNKLFYGVFPSPGTDVVETGNLTPSHEKSLLFATLQEAVIAEDSGVTAGTGFNLIQKTNIAYHLISEDKFNTGTSPTQATFSITTGSIDGYVGLYAIFKILTFLRNITSNIQAKKATISSSVDNIPSVSGSVQGKKSSISSSINNISSVAGTVQAKKSAVSGTVNNIIEITAIIQAKRSQLSGSVNLHASIAAAIQAKRSTLAGTINNISTIAATVQGKRATLTGDITHGNTVSAVIQAKRAQISASLDLISEITSSITSKRANLSGTIDNGIQINASIQSKKAQVSGEIDNISTVASSIQAKKCSISSEIDNIISILGSATPKRATLSGDLNGSSTINSSISAKMASISSEIMAISTITCILQSKRAGVSGTIESIATINSTIYAKRSSLHAEIGESFLIGGKSTLTIGLNCFYS